MKVTAESNLLEAIFSAASHHPTRLAFQFSNESYTYEDFFSRVEDFRSYCEASSDKIIAVYATQEVNTYAAILAILFSGKAFLPINPKHPKDRNFEILKSAETKTIFISEKAQSYFDTEFDAIRLPLASPPKKILSPPLTTKDDDLAYLFFTSGSTGKSKGVPIRRECLNHFHNALVQIPGMTFSKEDRFLQMFDLTFDLANMGYLIPLAYGASVFPIEGKKKTFLEVSDILKREALTVALMVPSLLTFLAPYFNEYQAPSLRLCLFCGEALDEKLVKEFSLCVPNARLWNVYGPTEATIFCSYYEIPRNKPVESRSGVVSIGRPMEGTEFYLNDGELCLSGPQVALEYWRDRERSERAYPTLSFNGNLKKVYRTGDLVEERNRSYLYMGRADYQIKIDGFRVELGEIEHHARLLFPVENVVVVPQQANGFTRLFLYYQRPTALTLEEEKALLKHLSTKLPSYMVPSEVKWKKEFPLNSNQKVDRLKIHEA